MLIVTTEYFQFLLKQKLLNLLEHKTKYIWFVSTIQEVSHFKVFHGQKNKGKDPPAALF